MDFGVERLSDECLNLVEARSIRTRRHPLPIFQSDGWIIVDFET